MYTEVVKPKNNLLIQSENLLRKNGFRVTKARIDLLLLLRKIGKPLSVQDILSLWKGPPNQATIYRMLTDLANRGIIKHVAIPTGATHFEYTPDHPHHHHVICLDCGMIEDVEQCFVQTIQSDLIKNLSHFTKIDSHSLEFFGHCKKCMNLNSIKK